MLGWIKKSAGIIYEWSLSDDKKIDDLSAEEKVQQNTIEKLTTILSGEKSIYCHLQFLIRNDKTDMLILKQTKDAVRVSVCHYATVVANGFMHCGTTHDSFLRLVQSNHHSHPGTILPCKILFSPRNYTSLRDPILSQELYLPPKKYKLENMQ